MNMIRAGAWAGRQLRRAAARFPYFPDPEARCSAHGEAYCAACHRNPGSCAKPYGQCETWLSSGMHWDTCANRVRGW